MKRVSSRAIIIDGAYIWLMKRFKNNINYYAIPGGGVEKGETLEETVIREIQEEFCVLVKVLGYLGYHENTKHLDYIYHCEIIKGIPTLGGEEKEKNSIDNHYEVVKVPLKDLPNLEIHKFNKDFITRALNKNYQKTPIFHN